MPLLFNSTTRSDVERQYLIFLGAGAGVNMDGVYNPYTGERVQEKAEENVTNDVFLEKVSTPPTPNSNTAIATRLKSNLGNWLQSCFQSTGDEHDLAEAISPLERAVEFAPDGRLYGTFMVNYRPTVVSLYDMSDF
ncbi:hypothetical protein DFP72DRAFT_1058216 [Ephemerocybe angulata]|uniref:Uncharacterized protein n=1 Tax=Ephemerocybe angulata TaxID=980116 RepID=A0A8H6MH26_9AGAR|nr:hypothetical protein DFP72DRAFT_1058216 [Tulosesus angulatus]